MGNGFFVVMENLNEINYENFFFIWVGLFVLDGDGNLINVVGYYFVGFFYDIDGILVVVDCGFFVVFVIVNVFDFFVVVEFIFIIVVWGNLLS